jgi:hypothetical protein
MAQIQQQQQRGKGSLLQIKRLLDSDEMASREKQTKEECFDKKEYKINDRFAKNNSHVVFFKDSCYKVTGSATFEDGYSWRCGHAKYHIAIDEKDEETGEHYIFMVIGNKQIKMDDETVVWPEYDEDIYKETMVGRELISAAKWKHKMLTEKLTLKMKDDLHYIRSVKTRKRKSENFEHEHGKKGKHY